MAPHPLPHLQASPAFSDSPCAAWEPLDRLEVPLPCRMSQSESIRLQGLRGPELSGGADAMRQPSKKDEAELVKRWPGGVEETGWGASGRKVAARSGRRSGASSGEREGGKTAGKQQRPGGGEREQNNLRGEEEAKAVGVCAVAMVLVPQC